MGFLKFILTFVILLLSCNAWAAVTEGVKIQEPVITWNLFVSTILTGAVGLMVWSLKRTIVKADELKEKLIANAINTLEKSIVEWQTGAKERTKYLCDKIDRLAHEKVDGHECERLHKSLDQTLDDIKRRVYT